MVEKAHGDRANGRIGQARSGVVERLSRPLGFRRLGDTRRGGLDRPWRRRSDRRQDRSGQPLHPVDRLADFCGGDGRSVPRPFRISIGLMRDLVSPSGDRGQPLRNLDGSHRQTGSVELLRHLGPEVRNVADVGERLFNLFGRLERLIAELDLKLPLERFAQFSRMMVETFK
jgi:hypothetical protein